MPEASPFGLEGFEVEAVAPHSSPDQELRAWWATSSVRDFVALGGPAALVPMTLLKELLPLLPTLEKPADADDKALRELVGQSLSEIADAVSQLAG